jgi:hypothetical protein
MAEEKTKQAEPEKPDTAEQPAADAKEQTKEEKKADKASKKAKFDAAVTVHVKVYSPFQTYYDDEAESISAENATGPFDILPRHHNFITLLVPCELDIKSAKGGDKKISITRGVMHVHNNSVTIFLDV